MAVALEALTIGQRDEAERQRLSELSAASKEADAVMVEVLFRDKWVRFDVSVLEVQHLTDLELLARYFRKALKDVGAPDPVRAD